MKKLVFTFGRMNPPTVGHQKLVDKVNSVAKSNNADAQVYLSHTQNDKKDPLDYRDKIKYARKAFGNIVIQSKSRTVFDILKDLNGKYTDVIMVVGSDRVPEFDKLLKKYNGKDYEFDSITVVSAGERDPDATGVEGMSASKLRALAKDGDFDTFKTGLPKRLTDKDAKEIFDTINKVIKEEVELDENSPLSIAQRNAKARQMKRLAPKLARFRKIKAKRKADKDTLQKRAQKQARNIIRKKVAGDRGSDYSALSASEKISIDKLVDKKTAVIKKLAKKLLPKVRQQEIERLKQARSSTNEQFDAQIEELFDMNEQKVAQDKDIKDKEGTQPKKYFKDLSKSTKDKRDAAFKKGKKASDDDPKAYKPAPGDAEAETKPSKHTKKYHQMFGDKSEATETDQAKSAIEREKERDAERHKAMLDRAKDEDQRDKEVEAKRKEAEKKAAQTQKEEFELTEDAKAALEKKAEKSGISYSILKKVYDRGMAAWKTGHRPGATQQQWGFARVNSFITGGKTRTTADADLWKQHKGKSESVDLDERSPWGDLKVSLSKRFNKNYEKALQWMKKTGKSAADAERMFRGTDARELAKMYDSMKTESINESYVMAKGEFKMHGLFKHHQSVLDQIEEEGGAGEEGTDKLVKKYKKDTPISEAVEYHKENGLSIKENIFRPHSEAYYEFFRECRKLYESGDLQVEDSFDRMLLASDAGELAIYEGIEVPLDIPLLEEEDKELNKPKRGGPKKFYVFVKDPSTGNIKKVTFGDTSGLKAKIDDPEARKSFAARHKCSTQKDKTTAAYWACRLPYYAKELGLSGGGSFFW